MTGDALTSGGYDATRGGGRIRAGRNVDVLTDEDISDILEEFPWEVEPADLRRVLTDERAVLIYEGRLWGWGDTAARDALATLLGIDE